MTVVSKKTINVAGLWVHVYTHNQAANTTLPVAVLFILHGRTSDSKSSEAMAHRVLQDINSRASKSPPSKELIVVTFDQRNHSSRLLSKQSNLGWSANPENHNETHAVDMYAIQTGTARDVSFLIDFLAPYLYPNDERQIVEWIVSGISLGGHATWITLKNEPRIKIGIPIIGSPDFQKLMEIRAKINSVELNAPLYPDSLRRFVEKNDPASIQYESSVGNTLYGKKILILAGGKDQLVQWEAGAEFVENLNVGLAGKKEIVIEENAGHECTPKMQLETARFVWEQALSKESL